MSVHTDDKEAPCGCYHNPEDPSICVCARDPYQCNKKVCAPNLATTGGKLICLMIVAIIGAVMVLQLVRPWAGGGRDEK